MDPIGTLVIIGTLIGLGWVVLRDTPTATRLRDLVDRAWVWAGMVDPPMTVDDAHARATGTAAPRRTRPRRWGVS